VAASAARSLGRRHEARRVAFCSLWARRCAPSPGRVSSAVRFAALAVVVGLAASGRKASSVVCARFTPAPLLSARLRRQNGGRGIAWFVVRGFVVAPVLRAPASPSARARRVLGLRGAWWASAFSFLKRSLRATPAPAAVSFVGGRCHGPCFSALANPRLGFAAPGSFGESRARQSAVQPGWLWLRGNGIS